MPRGDRTGPLGEGPKTGRAAGYCAGHERPGFFGAPGIAMSASRPGMAAGFSGSRGGAAGGGFGHRNRFFATGASFGGYTARRPEQMLSSEQETALPKDESERLRAVLETIEQRLAQIENA